MTETRQAAAQILHNHGLPDDVITRALTAHAHQLAEQQRREMRAPGRSHDASRWNRCVDMTADNIDPDVPR